MPCSQTDCARESSEGPLWGPSQENVVLDYWNQVDLQEHCHWLGSEDVEA